jgi:predicted component of type VI protein secretion system
VDSGSTREIRGRLLSPERKEPFVQSPSLSPPFLLAVDPLLLAVAGHPSTDSSRTLQQALPSLDAAWLAASNVLSAGPTGAALRECRPALQRVFAACVAELGDISAALETAATVYGQADGVAVPAPR